MCAASNSIPPASVRMRILVVDDDVSQLQSIKRYLNTAGLSVITCNSTAEAILALDGIPIDAVISDIQMPGENGIALIKWVDNHLPEIPVFAMTAFGSDEIYRDVLQNGAVVYLEKPFDFKLLVQLLVSSKDSCRNSNCFVTACLEAASSKGTGEVVVHNSNQIGQIFYYRGKIAWANIQNSPITFLDELISAGAIERDQLSELIRECKHHSRDFFVELVSRQIMQESQLKAVVHRYISNCFSQCLQWDNSQVMYIDSTRTYQGRILFDLVDILTLVNTSQTIKFKKGHEAAPR
ncbi:MAG: response regulator [Deltaproteobacteria bacterium]|nr:response regulator [Deltaproteobacteria bacterium]